ncbi:MAG: zinc ribbon domain-containing protein [Lachnospiraceae bacterium]|nr:zinc ribbon domain-containing protein [Lachnospiraceae bacterium]
MICKNCGKEVPDTEQYCPECSAPLIEPVVISKAAAEKSLEKKKEDAEILGPAFDFSGYINRLAGTPAAVLSLLGALLVYLAPFFRWIYISGNEFYEKANLFDVGKNAEKAGKDILALGQAEIGRIAVFILVTAVAMLVFSAYRDIRSLKDNKLMPFIAFVPVIALVILLVLALRNDRFYSAIRQLSAQAKGSPDLKGGLGIGFYMYIGGGVCYLAACVLSLMEYLKNKG